MDRRKERSTLEMWIWPNITHFDYEASQNSHILLLLLQSSIPPAFPPSFLGYVEVLPPQTANSFQQSNTQATGEGCGV